MSGRDKMALLMAQSDLAVRSNIEALLQVAAEELEYWIYDDEAEVRREAARYASVLSTYVANKLISLDRAAMLMKQFIRTGVASDLT